MNQRVAVFGLGYVGCVTAACLSRDGHRVVGVDIDAGKVAAVNQGRSPVLENGLEALVREQVGAGRLRATTDPREAVGESELGLIAVGTPSADDGSVQTGQVERVVRSIGQALRAAPRPYTLALRSTLLPGLLEERLASCLDEALGWEAAGQVQLCNNPEFLRETTAIADFDQPPLVVVGASDPVVGRRVLELYQRVSGPRVLTDTRTAAMLKYASNAYHALKVAYANEIGALSRSLGIDGQEVMRLVCQDTRLNVSPAYLRPGFAFGGSCLPKDVRALERFAQREAVACDVLAAILSSNQAHLQRAIRAIRADGSRKLGLIGLSYKAESDDLRESPLVLLAETLLGRGCDLRIYDPHIRVPGLVGSNLSYIERHLPHLAALLVDRPEALWDHAELLIIGSDVADGLPGLATFPGRVFDLRRDLVASHPTEWLAPT